jgi:hypothetical protein
MNAIADRRRFGSRVVRAPRTVTTLVAAKLVVDGREGLCCIRNVAPGGLMFETATPLERGQRVAVELRDQPPIEGTVAWRQGLRAGLAFDAPVEIAQLFAPAPTIGSRLRRARHPRPPRIAVDQRVSVELAAGRVFGQLVDISQAGAGLALPVTPAAGEWLTIELPGLARKRAVVRWIGDQVGVSFAEPIRFDALSAWLAAPKPI